MLSPMLADSFEEVWEASRQNTYSWGYPAAICCGAIILALLSLIRTSALRRTLKVVTIFAIGFIAFEVSAREIAEKWRLRLEWASHHPEQLTDAARESLTADGANLTLGPLIYGLQATALLMGIAAVLSVVRSKSKSTCPHDKT